LYSYIINRENELTNLKKRDKCKERSWSIMEDPVRFEIWGKILPGKRDKVLPILSAQSIFPSELELRKALKKAVYFNVPLRISAPLDYANAQKLATAICDVFMELTYCQEGATSPNEEQYFCEKHNFHFGGCLGCHICNGFYLP
jgi:hypothetical protein